MKKLILSILLFLLVASSTGCTILNDSQSSIENDDKLIIDQTSTKNTSDVLIQALETNDAELFKSVFSEQTLKLQPDIDEGIKYIFNIFEGDNLEIVYENQSSESFSEISHSTSPALNSLKESNIISLFSPKLKKIYSSYGL